MADQIEGLPEGATVGPMLQAQPQVEGLPEGATVGPSLQSHTQTAQPPKAVQEKPKGMLDTASDYWEKKAEPVDKAITGALSSTPEDTNPQAGVIRSQVITPAKTLGRELYSGAKTALGMPMGIYHGLVDPATEEEKAAQAPFEKEHG